MSRKIYFLVLIFLCGGLLVSAQSNVFINELHYDDASPGDSNEGVEVAGLAGTDLNCYRILMYNGNNGRVYNTINLSGVLPNQCNGFGTAWFDVPGAQNGSPDGVALVYSPTLPGCTSPGVDSVLQFLSYEGSFVAADSTALGMTSTDIGVSESNSTASNQSLQLTGNGTAPGDFTWTSGNTFTHNNLNAGQTFNGVCGVIIASELRFISEPTGCYPPGTSFGCEVCATDGFGNTALTYTGMVTVSKLSGTGNLSGTMSLPLVNGCAAFSVSADAADTYTLQATDGGFTASSRNIYISAQCTTCPWLTGAFIDACGSNEGNNEILFLNSGDFALGANSSDIVVDYGLSNPPATNYTAGFVSNQPYVDSLNARSGCAPDLFIDAYSNQPIPPVSNIMLFRYNPLNVYDFSNLCSMGPIYVLFSSDPDWNTTGNFKNCTDCGVAQSGTAPRFFRSNFAAVPGGSTCDFTYEYNPCTDLSCNGNGDGLNFPYGGGTPSVTWSECVPNTPLPVLFADPLTGRWSGSGALVQWATVEESHSSHFVLERALARENVFVDLARIDALGDSDHYYAYSYHDESVPGGDFLYRLRQVDLNGQVAFSNTVRLRAQDRPAAVQVGRNAQSASLRVQLFGSGAVEVRLIDVQGRVVFAQAAGQVNGAAQLEMDGVALPEGVYFYRVRVGNEILRGKVAQLR
ncbi:MAG: T9SS type A sorting domain-containing protein [Bacteroidota bacterium]